MRERTLRFAEESTRNGGETCCESRMCMVRGAINSWCDRMDNRLHPGVPSCRFYQVRELCVELRAHSENGVGSDGGKDEDDEICWTGAVAHRSCIHDGVPEAFEERGVLPRFVEYGAAVLANGGEGIQPGGRTVHG